jgi:hypothetical protein
LHSGKYILAEVIKKFTLDLSKFNRTCSISNQ